MLALRLAITTALLTVPAGLGFASAHANKPAPAQRNALRYELDLTDTASQYVGVKLCLPEASLEPIQVSLPAWTPGSYMIRDFARHVYDVTAIDTDKQPRAVTRLDKDTWEIAGGRSPACISYRVFADELSVRTSYLSPDFAVISAASVFFYVEGKLNAPATVSIRAPGPWQVHAGAQYAKANDRKFAVANYDALADTPIIAGPTRTIRYSVNQTDFEYTVLAAHGTNADATKLAADSERAVRQLEKWVGPLDAKTYSFFMILDRNGGGLEHRYATSMLLPPFMFTEKKSYLRAMGLATHEFFHAWNVKRMHSAALGPFDYSQENYSDLLWFHEGFTSAMQLLTMHATGDYSDDEFVEQLQSLWSRFQGSLGRNHTPISQLSRDAWYKEYKSASNHNSTVISYYLKGEVIGLALDLELRKRAHARGKEASLPLLFAALLSTREPGQDRIVSQADIEAAASQLAGEDMHWFFSRYVDGTQELHLPTLLEEYGVEVISQKPWLDDKGELKQADSHLAVTTGMILTSTSPLTIRQIVPTSPANQTGLLVGDELVAINGIRVAQSQDLAQMLAGKKAGERINVTFFRGPTLKSVTLRLQENPERNVKFKLRPEGQLSPEIKRLRSAWLKASSPSPSSH